MTERCGPMKAPAGTARRVPNNSPAVRIVFMGEADRRPSCVIWRCGPWAEKDCAHAMIGSIVGGHRNATRPFQHDLSIDRRRQSAEANLARGAEPSCAAAAHARAEN